MYLQCRKRWNPERWLPTAWGWLGRVPEKRGAILSANHRSAARGIPRPSDEEEWEKEKGGRGRTEGAKNENVANASPGRHFLESLRHGIKWLTLRGKGRERRRKRGRKGRRRAKEGRRSGERRRDEGRANQAGKRRERTRDEIMMWAKERGSIDER